MPEKPTYEELEQRVRVLENADSERKKAEVALRERVKELNCLQSITELIEREDSIDKILQGCVNVMVNGWSYPDIACARIISKDRQYQTENFSETIWRQFADLKVKGKPVGVVEVCYLEKPTLSDEGPFLKEERDLINLIGERLGRVIERWWTEEALRESEKLLARSQEIAHLGTWKLDLSTNDLTWSDEVYRILGCKPQEFATTYEAFLDFVHPDDRVVVDDTYSSSLLEGRGGYDIEHRITRKDTGEVRYVREQCIHERDVTGVVIRSIGIIQDITEWKLTSEREAHLKQVLLAIRNVNQLITMESDPARLIERSCKNLTETMGYDLAWIALTDESTERVVMTASAGFDGDYQKLCEPLAQGQFPTCMQRALENDELVMIEDPGNQCIECQLQDLYSGQTRLIRRMEYKGRVYGVVTVCVHSPFAGNLE